MRILIPLLFALGAAAPVALAQEQAAAPSGTASPADGATLSAAVTNPVPPSAGNPQPNRQAATPVIGSTARTIDLAGLRTSAPRPATEPDTATATIGALRGTALLPEATLEARVEGGLRTVIRDVPREVLRPTARLQGIGLRLPFEAPNLHVVATEGSETAAASAFEELN